MTLTYSNISKAKPLLILCIDFVPQTSITFVSKASVESGTIATYNLRKRIEVVKNCRKVGKKDMKYNDSMPRMKVDPETYVSNPAISHSAKV